MQRRSSRLRCNRYISNGSVAARKKANTIVLLEGALIAKSEENRAVMGWIKGLGLNLASLPQDTLY